MNEASGHPDISISTGNLSIQQEEEFKGRRRRLGFVYVQSNSSVLGCICGLVISVQICNPLS
jgi:hypothetical protein